MDDLADELSCATIDVDKDEMEEEDEGTMVSTLPLASSSQTTMIATKDSIIKISPSQSSNSQTQPKNHHKPVTRSASILIRSKLLILSDSETDDTEDTNGSNSNSNSNQDKSGNSTLTRTGISASGGINGLTDVRGLSTCAKNKIKTRRIAKKKRRNNERQKKMLSTLNLSTFNGKRKRSSTISEGCHASAGQNSGTTGSNLTSQTTDGTSSIILMEFDNQSDYSSSLSDTPCNSDNNFDGDDEQSDFYEVMSRTSSNKTQRANYESQKSPRHYHSHHAHKPPIEFPIPTHASSANPFLTMGLSPASTSHSINSTSPANMIWKRRRRMH